jgi:2-polyprenyl-6-methoxyphenol hydroxylase-like FAD-dependent oxidoreductase
MNDALHVASRVPGAPHVLVAGAGIGGLCLAQGLRRAGVGVTVFETDPSPASRGQGYRITLKSTGVSALRSCLPPDLYALCLATSIRPATTMTFTDERLTPRFSKPIPALPPEEHLGVNRLTLREILLSGLDGDVRFGAAFESFDRTGDGRVLARLADGSTAAGDLLVGADGTGSAVRRIIAPQAELEDLGGFVYGRTTITPGLLDWVPQVLLDSFNRVTGPVGAMSVATCRRQTPAAGPGLTGIPGYLAWTIDGWPDGPPAGARPEELHRLAAEMIGGWHPAVRRIVAEAEVAATFAVRLRSALPFPPWHAPGVTLLGDAVHTMSPGRGEGANIALKDAALLAAEIAAAGPGGLGAAVARYEREMFGYAFEAVAGSRDHPFAPRRR